MGIKLRQILLGYLNVSLPMLGFRHNDVYPISQGNNGSIPPPPYPPPYVSGTIKLISIITIV